MKHVTETFKPDGTLLRGVIYVTVPPERCKRVDAALTFALGDRKNKKSRHICDCIVNGPAETVYQARNEHAQKIILRTQRTPAGLETMIADIEKALMGWPTTTSTQFVDEDSAEYQAWAQTFVEDDDAS